MNWTAGKSWDGSGLEPKTEDEKPNLAHTKRGRQTTPTKCKNDFSKESRMDYSTKLVHGTLTII
jgi:hypothetical protein